MNFLGGEKSETELLYELEQQKQLNNNLMQQNNLLNYRIQELLSMNSIGECFDITAGEYVGGVDIKPGRYNIFLISGDNGRIETSGRNWIIETFGILYNGISYYENLVLKMNQKLNVVGNIRLRLVRQKPLNIDEDVSVIEELQKQVYDLKEELKNTKKNISQIDINEKRLPDEYVLTQGYYYGGVTIKMGIYDAYVISGSGSIHENGKIHQLGTWTDHNHQQVVVSMFRGIKITQKTKIEISGNLQLRMVKVG